MNTKHSRQKAFSLVAFLMLLVATTAQAKRVVERPYFLGSNNHKLEIERVTLDKKATLLDVKIYQASGDVGIDSHASIMANGVKYDYIGSNVSLWISLLPKISNALLLCCFTARLRGSLSFICYFVRR